MAMRVAVHGALGPEHIDSAVETIGKSKQRAAVFRAIYTGQSRMKRIVDLMNACHLPRTRVLDAGKALDDADIVQYVKGKDGLSGYKKIPFFQRHRDKILRMVASPAARAKLATVRRSPTSKTATTSVKLFTVRAPARKIRAKPLTIDDISAFSQVKKLPRKPQPYTRISEKKFKHGVARILGEQGARFKDWGGELSDLYSTALTLDGKRRRVAFAFKGPGMTGTLVPGKMGQNGDQIQRLLKCPADVFLVQYWRDIADSVMDQLQQLAELLSYQRDTTIYYGIIDGADSTRMIQAYRSVFSE
jgi:hypothetical protein